MTRNFDTIPANGVERDELALLILRILSWKPTPQQPKFDIEAQMMGEGRIDVIEVLSSSYGIELPSDETLTAIPPRMVERIDPALETCQARHDDNMPWKLAHIVTILQQPSHSKTA